MAETTDPVDETVDDAPKRPRKAAETAPEPTVGRIVQYTEPGTEQTFAALITVVRDDADKGTASLAIWREHLQFFRKDVPFSEKPKAGHWHWPERK